MKEGKVFKRILAIALVVVMTITMVPFGVFAAESTDGATECPHNVGFVVIAHSTATCEKPANLQYYQCKGCNGYFNRNTNGQLSESVEPAEKEYGVALGHDF